jgi:hypothetical protein
LPFRQDITGYERLVTYILKIEPDATGRAVVAREILRFKRGASGTRDWLIVLTQIS